MLPGRSLPTPKAKVHREVVTAQWRKAGKTLPNKELHLDALQEVHSYLGGSQSTSCEDLGQGATIKQWTWCVRCSSKGGLFAKLALAAVPVVGVDGGAVSYTDRCARNT